MKTEIKEVYRCEHCNKFYQRKHACKIHEGHCNKNPENYRACLNHCEHLHKKEVRHYYDTYCGESWENVTLLHCKKKDIFVYPPKVEVKKNWFDLGDKFNEPMPKKCDLYKFPEI